MLPQRKKRRRTFVPNMSYFIWERNKESQCLKILAHGDTLMVAATISNRIGREFTCLTLHFGFAGHLNFRFGTSNGWHCLRIMPVAPSPSAPRQCIFYSGITSPFVFREVLGPLQLCRGGCETKSVKICHTLEQITVECGQ